MEKKTDNYTRIAEAISYIRKNFRKQPSLEEVARNAGLSESHFQKLFTEWAGISPKKFLQFTNLEYARKILAEEGLSLFDTAWQTGLSGTGRLHDLFVKIEGMTPGEYKNGGSGLHIRYSFENTLFGRLIIASTSKGICYMAFCEDKEKGSENLKNKFPNALFTQTTDSLQQTALSIFKKDWKDLSEIKLHLKGTAFQLKVWETLLRIPAGSLTTYGNIAARLNSPGACRAVGTAVGDNPVAYIIPCHRVIRSSGELGGYHWGLERKIAMIGLEAALINK